MEKEDMKAVTTRELQTEIETVAGDMSRGEIGDIIESIKGPRKIINDFVIKHAEFVKILGSPDTHDAAKACGSVVSNQRSHLQSLAQRLLSSLEHWRWTVDERIAMLRRQEALAKDKYGNERKPLELSPEEQELAYDLRGAAMRDSFEQTQAIQRELKVTRMLQRAREEVMEFASQPPSHLSRTSMLKVIDWYKRQLNVANNRAQQAEEKLKACSDTRSSPVPRSNGGSPQQTRPKTAAGVSGPADVKHLQEKLTNANRELDYLRKRVAESDRELITTRQKLAGTESVIERLAKIANRERSKSGQLEREITRLTEHGLANYGVVHRTFSTPPPLLPTTTGEAISKK